MWLDPQKTPLLERPVDELKAPERLVLPLPPAASPCVREGAFVEMGQPLARREDGSPALHSPVSGVVAAAVRGVDSPARIVLENDGRDTPFPRRAGGKTAGGAPSGSLSAALREAAVLAALSGRPLADELAAMAARKTRLLVLHVVETEPYLCVSQKLLDENPDDVAAGFLLLMSACGARLAAIAVGDDVPSSTVDAFTASARMRGLAVQVEHIPQKYPAGDERYLRPLLESRGLGAQQGAAVRMGFVCPEDCLFALRARDGEPQLSRFVAVAGDAVTSPRILEVRIGTPVRAVFDRCGLSFEPDRVVLGGPMRGVAVTDLEAPVEKGTGAVLALRAPHHPASRSLCIGCGKCVSVCPEGLLPNYIAQRAVSADFDALRELRIEDCVECGCCSYVCPGRMPIVELIKNIKKAAQ